MTHIAPPTNKRLFFERRSQFSHYRGIFRVVRACSTKIQSTGWAPSRLAAVPRRNGSTSSQCQLPLKSLGRFAPAADGWNPPSTSTIRHMLHRASASAKRLAAALRRAVPEWQLLSGWVQTGREENGSLRNGKAIIFGRTGVRSCQRHVNARMSFCECF